MSKALRVSDCSDIEKRHHDLPDQLLDRHRRREMMPVEVTAEYVKQRIAQFFTNDWPHVPVQDITVARITEGYSNMIHLVKRPSQAGSKEPDAVILRHYGGNAVDASTTEVKLKEVEEIMVAKEMSDHGLGPTLYGVFPGGRVEEYVEGRTLTPDDLRDTEISREIARNMARMHALTPPLARGKFDDHLTRPWVMDQEVKEALVAEFKDKHPELLAKIQALVDWDTRPEKLWLHSIISSHRMRKSLAFFDTNCLNILMRADRSLVKVGLKKSFIVLIDYETSNYGFSGVDIGAHLTMHVADPRNKVNLMSGYEYPGDSFIREFVSAYVAECRLLGTWDDSVDSLEDMIGQTLIGTLFNALFMHQLVLKDMPQMLTSQPVFVNWIHKIMSVYQEVKRKVLML